MSQFLNLPQKQQWKMIQAINQARADNSPAGSYANQVWAHNAKMNDYWAGMDPGNTPKVAQYGGSMRHMRDISGPTARGLMETLGGYGMNEYLDSFQPITNYSFSMGGTGVGGGSGDASVSGYDTGREGRQMESLLASLGLIDNTGDVARFADPHRASGMRDFGGVPYGGHMRVGLAGITGRLGGDARSAIATGIPPRHQYEPSAYGGGSSFAPRQSQGMSMPQAGRQRGGAPDDAYYRNFMSQDQIGELRRNYAKQHPKTHAPDGNPYLNTPQSGFTSNFNNRNRYAQEARAGGYDSDLYRGY